MTNSSNGAEPAQLPTPPKPKPADTTLTGYLTTVEIVMVLDGNTNSEARVRCEANVLHPKVRALLHAPIELAVRRSADPRKGGAAVFELRDIPTLRVETKGGAE